MKFFYSVLLVLNLSIGNVLAQGESANEREQIRWDLSEIYASESDWNSAYEDVKTRVGDIQELKNDFGSSASKLADALEHVSSIRKEFYRVAVYASLLGDEDQRVAEGQQRSAKISALGTSFSEATSWMSPAIIALGESELLSFIEKEPRLEPFDYDLTDLIRSAPHLLDEKGEAMMASAGAITGSPSDIYSLLANADIPWSEIELSDGKTVRLDQAGYSGARSSANREDRQKVFEQFWATWQEYQDSMGAILNTEVQANIFQAKARNYESVLDWQLSQENLPEDVYRTLVAQVNENLSTLHRYFELRGRILDVDDLRYYDIYPPLVEMETDFSIEASKEITLEVLQPLGEEYVEHLETALNSNWAHVYPQPGKRSGAYMNGSVYDVHPYVLLNHNDDYNSLSTYAHEWGHAVHTMLAKGDQPFEKAGYSTFTAEIASTINEILLEEYLIDAAKTKEEKLFYLGQALESIRGTFFRQTMFAEFELDIHETAERGEPLTGAIFSEKYAELLKKYHGHEQGVMTIDDAYSMEWAYIPHFYYDMYVFQYATSISGAAWFAEQFLAGDIEVRDAFIDSLKAGGSDDAYSILKTAGLDMASPEPYQAIIKRMDDIMNRIEVLLEE